MKLFYNTTRAKASMFYSPFLTWKRTAEIAWNRLIQRLFYCLAAGLKGMGVLFEFLQLLSDLWKSKEQEKDKGACYDVPLIFLFSFFFTKIYWTCKPAIGASAFTVSYPLLIDDAGFLAIRVWNCDSGLWFPHICKMVIVKHFIPPVHILKLQSITLFYHSSSSFQIIQFHFDGIDMPFITILLYRSYYSQ